MAFIEQGKKNEILVGVTKISSEQAVFADVINDKVLSFSRMLNHESHEWANVFIANENFISNINGFVYEDLQKHLPLPCLELILREIDTHEDMIKAGIFVRNGLV